MGKKLNQAFVNAMATVQVCQERIAALSFAVKRQDQHSNLFHDDANVSTTLFAALYDDLNRAYAYVFMLANVTRKEEHIKEARRIAYRHFLSEQHGIMQLLNLDFEYPGSYSGAEQDQFRKEIAASKEKGE